LRFAVLNGLRPEIANFVTQKQPTDLENLLETARLGEMCVVNQPSTDTVVTKQLAQMQDQLRQLSMKFDTPTAAPISDVTRGKMSPRRVHFDDENDKRSRSYDRRLNYDNRRPFNRSNSPVTRQRGFGRCTSSSYRSFRRQWGTIRPSPAYVLLPRTVVRSVRLVGTNADPGGPRAVIVAVCAGMNILTIALRLIRTAEAVEPKVTFCVAAARSGGHKTIGIDGPMVFR